MSDYDSLEAELAAMQPLEPSAELKRRIAKQLTVAPPRLTGARRPFRKKLALVGGLLAACWAAVVGWQDSYRLNITRSVATTDIDVTTAFDASLPSLWSYRQAVVSPSDDCLPQLLDRHALGILDPGVRIPAFLVARSKLDMDTFPGGF
jgi:hypothetical protein